MLEGGDKTTGTVLHKKDVVELAVKILEKYIYKEFLNILF